ncbi:hypothetical protein PPHE_b0745 [Pseudoalteromonas phenolica O-BC30]|nr:hypothetical protein [Pseudoalteromonas phenolica O-BC30]
MRLFKSLSLMQFALCVSLKSLSLMQFLLQVFSSNQLLGTVT